MNLMNRFLSRKSGEGKKGKNVEKEKKKRGVRVVLRRANATSLAPCSRRGRGGGKKGKKEGEG